MGEISERRRFPRYTCTGAVEILQQGHHCGAGIVTDISWLGCYIETVYPLTVGTLAKIRLNLLGISLDIDAMTVSVTPMFGMGMEFTAGSGAQESTFKQIIAAVSGEEASPAIPRAEDPQPQQRAF